MSEARRRALQKHLSCSPEPRPRRTTSAPVVLQMWRMNASPAARGGRQLQSRSGSMTGSSLAAAQCCSAVMGPLLPAVAGMVKPSEPC